MESLVTQLYRFAYARDVLDESAAELRVQPGKRRAGDSGRRRQCLYLLRNVFRSLNSIMMNSAASSRFSAA